MFEIIGYVLSLFFAVAIPLYILAPFLPENFFGVHIGGGSKKSVLQDDLVGFDK